VGSTVLPVTIGLLNVFQSTLPRTTEALLVGALIAYGVQIGCASVVFLSRRRDLSFRPNLEALQGYTAEFSGAALRRWVADEQLRAIIYNDQVLARKGRLALGVVTSLYVEAAFLSLSAFLTLL